MFQIHGPRFPSPVVVSGRPCVSNGTRRQIQMLQLGRPPGTTAPMKDDDVDDVLGVSTVGNLHHTYMTYVYIYMYTYV